MKKLLPLLLLFPAAVVLAAALNVTWTNPVQNTDNSAIPASGPGSIASTRIEYGTCNGAAFGTKLGEVVIAGQAESGVLPNLAPGTYCARAFTKNTYGEESDTSGVAQKVIAAPKPKPPSGFSWG